jgi:3-dehydroquinate synthase
MSTPSRIEVGGEAPYQVVVGSGLAGELPPLLAGAQRVAVLHQPTMRTAAAAIRDDLVAAGHQAHLVEVPDGEDAKTLAVAGDCWDTLGRLGFTRTDAVVGLGGGAVTDLAGCAASGWCMSRPRCSAW